MSNITKTERITTIEITEVYSKRIIIEHDASITDEDILDYVRKQYYNDRIELDYSNYLDTDFNIVENSETVEENPEYLPPIRWLRGI